MTTKTGARIYRGMATATAPGACTACGRVVSLTSTSRRRAHKDNDGLDCLGGGVYVGDPVSTPLDSLPEVVFPPLRTAPVRLARDPRADDDRRCAGCGQRPRIKSDGAFVSHRVDVDDPSSPRCPNGAELSRV